MTLLYGRIKKYLASLINYNHKLNRLTDSKTYIGHTCSYVSSILLDINIYVYALQSDRKLKILKFYAQTF